MRLRFTRSLIAAAAVLALQSTAFAADSSYAPDSVSAEFGTGNKTQMVRAGVQWDWNKSWFQSNGTHLGGYWDATVASWRQNKYQQIDGQTRNLTDIGFTPVFRFQRDDRLGYYVEGGIGVHRLSSLYDNDGRRLSTLFEFGDHIGAGYVFANHWDVGMKIQHFSNGGYRKPNSGVNWIEAKAAYRF